MLGAAGIGSRSESRSEGLEIRCVSAGWSIGMEKLRIGQGGGEAKRLGVVSMSINDGLLETFGRPENGREY